MEKVFAKGIRIFPKHEKQPDFVKGAIVITLNELVQFCKDNPNLLTDYQGQKQLKLQLLDGKNGLNLVVDTYKKSAVEEKSDLPF